MNATTKAVMCLMRGYLPRFAHLVGFLMLATVPNVARAETEAPLGATYSLSAVLHGVSYHQNRDLYAWNEVNPGIGFELHKRTSNAYGLIGHYLNSYNETSNYVGMGYTLDKGTIPLLNLDISYGVEAALVTGYSIIDVKAIAGVVFRIGDSIKVLVIPKVNEYTTTVIGISFTVPLNF